MCGPTSTVRVSVCKVGSGLGYIHTHHPWYGHPHTTCPTSLLPPPEALTLNKELEFAAIQAVLRHLDDNHDGSVDLQESEEVGHCMATPADMSYTHTQRARESTQCRVCFQKIKCVYVNV